MKNITPIQSTTQRHLLIADVVDDLVLTKEGGAALILRSSALNFSLLSQREQEAMTFAYAALLNSLSFPIQIFVRSQRKDVSDYLDFLAKQETKQENEKLRGLMSSYREFVINMVKKKNVLEKEFFIVIPFSPFEMGISARGVLGLVSLKSRRSVPFPKEYVVKKAKTALYPRRDHLMRQVGRLGLKLKQLTTEEILQLFSKIYTLEKGEITNGAP
ncbi:MAG: hypothetical protein HYS83_00065 [Candidatus Blackburnbacteria bacterium]|nr:hypothetical protein [Candidatus Blackburnbacteria bacterium]